MGSFARGRAVIAPARLAPRAARHVASAEQRSSPRPPARFARRSWRASLHCPDTPFQTSYKPSIHDREKCVKRHHSVRLVMLATLALALMGSGCKGVGGRSDAMAVIPKDASIVFSMNLDRLRGSSVWPVVQEARNDPSNKKDYDEFVQKTGLDPLT